MAKISELVKTYRLLSDPNAPDWNVKFVGAIALATLVVAAGAGALYWSSRSEGPASAPAALVQEPPPDAECAEAAPSAPTIPTSSPTPCATPSPALLP